MGGPSRYRAGVITNLHVEWVGDELRARWQGGEDPTVFVSGSPDDAGTVIVPVVSPGRLRVAGLPTGFRAYVHVLDLDGEWTVAGERLVSLGRAAHAVDLGGHRTEDGRAVGWGRLYAGDPIDDLDSIGRERFDGLHVHSVCDLRDPADSAGRPAWLAPDVRWELPGLGTGGAGTGDASGEGPGDQGDPAELDELPPVEPAAQIAEVVTLVSDPANRAILLHAGVGQDRAVVTTALLLSAVGVPDVGLPFFPTRPQVLADLRDRFGSVPGYLTAGAGLDEADLIALAEALLGT